MAVDTSKLKKNANRKGQPPAAAAPGAGNLAKPPSGQKAALQLKIPPELKREVKAYAAERDLEVSALFAQVWAFYREHHG
ncbi:hypothetical protein C2W62_21835 [Candidatus Entotheonella serta]|nr:hypothetical protein C2W62_21835 [Candidatus Entotheonella serta]